MPKLDSPVQSVLEEVKNLIENHPKDKKIQVRYEIVKRKYCFELDVDFRNEEVDVVKLNYSFRHGPLTWLQQ